MKFSFDWPSVFRGDGQATDGIRTDAGACVSYKLTGEPSAQAS